METITFKSSQISQGTYDDTKNILVVTFRNGSRYQYDNIPEVVWNKLKESESAGSYFALNIKGVYNYTKLS